MAVIPQFHNVSLSHELSLGARVKVAYQTKVIRMREGEEDRIGEWQDALRTFDLSPALRHQADLDILLAFFRARLGPVYAFKLRDPTDYVANFEYMGVGDGLRTTFALTKNYTSGLAGDNHYTVRAINLPDTGFLLYTGNDIVAPSQYTIDNELGVVAFLNSPAPGVSIHWSGTFQVPVRFSMMQMPTSYAMYQRFESQILLVEQRVPIYLYTLAEAQPGDFEEVLFPPTFAERSESGPQYDAIISSGASGIDQRIGQFLAPKIAFQVDQAVQSLSDMEVLLRFFHARRGKLVGFLALDYTDFQARDHLFAIGDGTTASFQLTKTYSSGGFSQVRPITRVVYPTAIYIGGVLVTDVQVLDTENGFEVLRGTHLITPLASVSSTGIVQFTTPPGNGVELRWTGMFYVPVRFDTDELDLTLDGPDVTSWSRIGLVEIPTTMTAVNIADIP